MSHFIGKTALITGAASGIGLATARELAAKGVARLVLVDKDAERLGSLEIEGSDLALLPGDVTDEQFWNEVSGELANIDLALINAGIATGSLITELTFSEWKRTLAVNLDGAFLTLRAVLRAMLVGEKRGAIVATASVSGLKAEPNIAAYGSSKAALIHLVRIAAKEVAGKGIRINAIAPGGVMTPIWDSLDFFGGLVGSLGSREAAFAEIARMATPQAAMPIPPRSPARSPSCCRRMRRSSPARC